MSDTQRSLAALQTLLADNTTNKISPQYLRDFLVSVCGGYGSIHVQDGATPQSVGTTPAKLTGFVQNGPASGATPDASDDEIAVDVTAAYWAEGHFSFTGTASRTFQIHLRVNGVESSGACGRAKTNTSGELVHVSFSLPVELIAADVVSVWAEADVDASSMTLVDGSLALKRLN